MERLLSGLLSQPSGITVQLIFRKGLSGSVSFNLHDARRGRKGNVDTSIYEDTLQRPVSRGSSMRSDEQSVSVTQKEGFWDFTNASQTI